MKLSNKQIYTYAMLLNTEFKDCNLKLPVKINFFLQKNIKTIIELGIEIEQSRDNIVKNFGEKQDDGTYKILKEKMIPAQNELNDLFSIEQEVNIHMFKLEEFNDIELTYKQMEAIMFMIAE